MLKANNENELLSILKIIAEESVRKSKKILNEEADKNTHQRYMDSLKKSESKYGVSLTEQEDEQPSQKVNRSSNDEKENIDDDNEDQIRNDDENLGDTEEFGVSFDSVIKNINTLRAGRSTKDKEIKEELLEYYDRLDDDERMILHIFLRELSKILRGAIDGSEALDPSDAPIYADIVLGKEADQDQKSNQKPERQKSRAPKNTAAGEEDSSPPIQVNETQNLQEIRKKFKNLLKRI